MVEKSLLVITNSDKKSNTSKEQKPPEEVIVPFPEMNELIKAIRLLTTGRIDNEPLDGVTTALNILKVELQLREAFPEQGKKRIAQFKAKLDVLKRRVEQSPKSDLADEYMGLPDQKAREQRLFNEQEKYIYTYLVSITDAINDLCVYMDSLQLRSALRGLDDYDDDFEGFMPDPVT